MKIRTGIGIDVHRLETGLPLWLGGVKIPSDKGCVAHSDGDVLIHAICDALLGAAGMRDIGYFFPDNSPAYKGIDSKILLKKTMDTLSSNGFAVSNVDSVICLQQPKLKDYIIDMRECLAEIMELGVDDIAVKATTTEQLGFEGREEGISAYATALIYKL
ncbi:MAG: 2-C-methyl-D-erythritol 2,4-cyclodiphosphate synthase [Culturomica sp.]|jgi:2-C-methyl-D-erythritol 2,4-cyclodiphosphate synthase|nr:2-C-methyl-D-erythritol 2,4-cyclodiphosphate synthase [Culturomica sp.]